MLQVEQRVNELEDLLAELLRAQGRTQRQLDQLSREMREFKNEMREFMNESNKRWGELANKMGTLAEDIVAPRIPRILRQVVDCPADQELDYLAIRVKPRHSTDPNRAQEYDVVALCGSYLLINETKPRLNPAYLDEFVQTLSISKSSPASHRCVTQLT